MKEFVRDDGTRPVALTVVKHEVGTVPSINASSMKLPCDRCAVRSLNLCQPLDNARLARLLALGRTRKWKQGEVLFRAGDPIGCFFKITRGLVAVSRSLDDGRRQIVAIRAAGDCVGYLHTNGSYTFDGRALTGVEACAFDRLKFDAFAALHADLGAAVADTLSAALRQTGQHMLVLGRLRSTERVAHFLAELVRLYGERHLATQPFMLQMGRREVADYLGLRVETVSRSLARLKGLNVLASGQGDALVILDREHLLRIAKLAA
jgi:CRP/FNR family transcriptional regulator